MVAVLPCSNHTAFHKKTDNPFAGPDPFERFRVGKCSCERRFKEVERAKQGSCLNLHEYANVSFWNHDRNISKVDVVKAAQEV